MCRSRELCRDASGMEQDGRSRARCAGHVNRTEPMKGGRRNLDGPEWWCARKRLCARCFACTRTHSVLSFVIPTCRRRATCFSPIAFQHKVVKSPCKNFFSNEMSFSVHNEETNRGPNQLATPEREQKQRSHSVRSCYCFGQC